MLCYTLYKPHGQITLDIFGKAQQSAEIYLCAAELRQRADHIFWNFCKQTVQPLRAIAIVASEFINR